ncbi:16013_t:CDS:1, partial [Funneliformis geosporum]
TVTNPFGQFIVTSSQKRVMLPITSLKPPERRINNSICPVFPDHQIVNMLVDDMGGHGRALETLEKALKNKDLDHVNFMDLSNDIRYQLGQTYSHWTQRSKGVKQLLRIILTHQLVYKDQTIFDNYTPEDFTRLGLIKFEPCDVNDVSCASGYLSCPYVWLWIVAHSTNDEILKDWNFNYIQERQHEADLSISPGLQYWQHFESFISRIRILKSKLFAENAWILLKDLHHGANHTFNNAKICNQHLQLETAIQRESTTTKSGKLSKIQCDKGLIDPCGKYC